MMMTSEIINAVEKGMTKEEADRIAAAQIAEIVSLGTDQEEATRRFKSNLGYFAGYYSPEIADKVFDLFETEHPIFGRSYPTPEEALKLGIEWGKRSREERRDG